MGILAAALNSEHTRVLIEHVARFTDTAFLAGGGGSWAGALTEAFWVKAGW